MRAPLRFAVLGKSGAGKSEVALILHERTGARIIKTGAICRDIAKLLFGNDDKRTTQLLDDALTPIDSSIFLRAALRKADISAPFIIDSLRFKSDLDIAHGLEAVTVRVIAEPPIRVARLQSRTQQFDLERDGSHRSESELDSAPAMVTIKNDGGDLVALRDQVDRALSSLR